MANSTSNLGLNQYANTDPVITAAEYSSDMQKIDTAVGDNAANISLRDLSSQISAISGVSGIRFYAVGHIKWLRFTFQPTSAGFTIVATCPTEFLPGLYVPLAVGSANSSLDLTKGIGGHVRENGDIVVVAPATAGYSMAFSAMWMTWYPT